MSDGFLYGRYPAIVRTYDQVKRTCRIEIPGLTDGAEVFPEAEIEYPIGDKSKHESYSTEIEILPGDTVWACFIGGDPRYPIVTGYRNPQTGNGVDWRRIHHKNCEVLTDVMMHVESAETIKADAGNLVEITSGQAINADSAKTINVKAGDSIKLSAGSKISLSVGGSTIEISPSSISIVSGNIVLNGPLSSGGGSGATATFNGPVIAKQTITASSDIVAGDISLMNHVHTEQGDGANVSKPKTP